MSIAAVEKPAEKPAAAPLTSFLTKMRPKPSDKPVEAKAEEKQEAKDALVLAKDDEPRASVASADAPPAQASAKPAEKTEVKADDKPKDEVTEKRLKDTQKWGNEEHKARLDAERKAALLEAQLARIEAKLDGTYVEPTGPSTEQLTADADIRGRIKASHKAAVRQYGEPFVMETVWNTDSPYQELQARDPRVKARVMESEDPVGEAIAVVKEEQDRQKYGRTPEEIRKKMEEELLPQLEKKILEGLKTKPGPATNTLGNVRGGAERSAQQADPLTRLNFAQVFPHGRSRT